MAKLPLQDMQRRTGSGERDSRRVEVVTVSPQNEGGGSRTEEISR